MSPLAWVALILLALALIMLWSCCAMSGQCSDREEEQGQER